MLLFCLVDYIDIKSKPLKKRVFGVDYSNIIVY